MGKDMHGDFLRRVDLVHAFERFGITGALDGIDMRLQAPAIEPMDALRWH